MDIETGVAIVMNSWVQARPDELIHLITDESHRYELEAFERWTRSHDAVLKSTVLPSGNVQKGIDVESMAHILAYTDVVIGATGYSFITTGAVRQATKKRARFLSLPLDCKDGTSLLEHDFIAADPRWCAKMAKRLLHRFHDCDTIRVTTKAGTDLTLSKRGRWGGYFNGVAAKRGAISSASYEMYIPVEERKTEGRLVLDGSLGYLGPVTSPFAVEFRGGELFCADTDADATRLFDYIESFHDPAMRISCEFGIGLNTLAKCRGICYIEDESAYGTFHIGMGRNISLGGAQEAEGHFDLIANAPTVYAGAALVMLDGKLIYD